MGLHSECLISGLHATSPPHRSGASTAGELNRHPAWTTRKKNQAADRRLSLQLAILDQRCQEITARLSHDMKLVKHKLRLYRVSNDFQKVHPLSSASFYENNHRSLTGTSDPPKISVNSRATGQGQRSVEQQGEVTKKAQSSVDQNQLVETTSNSWPNSSVRGKSTTPTNISPASRRRRRRLIPRPCDFGTTSSSVCCSHFPCRQPRTYHSLGFRLDDSSTDEWISWTELKKIKTSLTDNPDEAADWSSGAASIKHRLPPGATLRPLDVEFKEKLLQEEVNRRRKLNRKNKPPSWEVNYGKPIPFKRLRLPYRLKPMELTSW